MLRIQLEVIKSNVKIVLIAILIFICFNACKSFVTQKDRKQFCSCEERLKKKVNYCDLLRTLSDTTVFKKRGITKNCFIDIIKQLYHKTNIEPSWVKPEYGDWKYYNMSMDCSLYKDDLLSWMRYFKCADTVILLKPTKGKYTQDEIMILKSKGISIKE